MNEKPGEKKKMTRQQIVKEIVDWTLTIVIPVVVALLIHNYLFTFARVDGPSMLDTFTDNSIMGVSRLHYRLNAPARGEVVTCHYDEGSKLYVKRIMGLPGETLEIKEGIVYIDGKPLDEPYLTRIEDRDWGPYAIGEDEMFVMGDNRPISLDCRQNGSIPLSYLYGRVIFVALPIHDMRMTMDVPTYE